ncbi:MAG: FHA domain-containing protein [Thermoanaerobaculia bacterium]|nr:FHA domain-containing protein [Thermoanaerobaculia bacterium]
MGRVKGRPPCYDLLTSAAAEGDPVRGPGAASGNPRCAPRAPRPRSRAPGSPAPRRDLLLLVASRVATRLGDGFLRVLAVLLVAAKSKDPMIAGLVLVSRYVCEILINAVSGPVIDRLRIRTSLLASDLARTALAAGLVAAVLGGAPYPVYLVLSFLGDFVFLFFKPAVDKVVKVSYPAREGTKVLSLLDAANHASNIGGYGLASLAAGLFGSAVAVVAAPFFFALSALFVSALRLPGESVIDYRAERKASYWVRQREGLRYTWASPPLRLLLLGRSLVAVARGSFSVLSVAYLASLAGGLAAYGYFESAQSAGKVLVTALVIPLFFAYRSTFLLTALALVAVSLSFFGLNLVGTVTLACVVGGLVGAGQAAEAVGIDAIVNRYADARIQGRAKSTTSFGSRLSGLAAIGIVYLLVSTGRADARELFAWLGVFPLLAAAVFLLGWLAERGSLAELEFPAEREPAHLAVHEPGRPRREVALGEKALLIGRAERNDLVLADPEASRFHAALRPERQGWAVEDLRSANGVWLDGERVEKAPLVPGSRIQIGQTLVIFERGPAAAGRGEA